nr:glucuronate isomerase [Feifania hominis]
MDENFLLDGSSAEQLFKSVEKLPIVDFHCHLSAQEIAQDKSYESITELWLGHDHYKWRAMRFHGIEEQYITGDADPREKFRAFAQTLEHCLGNPLYHWSHMELSRYFGIYEPLSTHNCDEVYDRCNRVLQSGLSARKMIQDSNVEMICTTDDPCDSLEYHSQLQREKFQTLVVPSFRPDGALRIEAKGFREYVSRLAAAADVEISDFNGLCCALERRLKAFCALGCRVSDHALEKLVFAPDCDRLKVRAFEKAMRGEEITEQESRAYQTALLVFLAKLYRQQNVAMQLHVGCMRNINTRMFNELGPDTGYDAILDTGDLRDLARLFDRLEQEDSLPRTIVFPLDGNANRALFTICTSFGGAGRRGYVQIGPAWWFNDTKSGMENQLRDFADLGCLGDFVGMLTDSRSLISYPRHEYFRRILCNMLGRMMDCGEIPQDMELAGKVAENICYYNAADYFGLKQRQPD